MTLDQAIEQLNALRAQSPLGGETALVVCLLDSERDEMEVERIQLDGTSDIPRGGALVQIYARLPEERGEVPPDATNPDCWPTAPCWECWECNPEEYPRPSKS